MWYLELETTKRPDEVVAGIQDAVAAESFRVLYVHDITQALADKGFEMAPFRIVEVCSARQAKKALDTDRRFGLLMPCRISVFEDAGRTIVQTVKPTELIRYFPESDMQAFADEVEQSLTNIMAAAV